MIGRSKNINKIKDRNNNNLSNISSCIITGGWVLFLTSNKLESRAEDVQRADEQVKESEQQNQLDNGAHYSQNLPLCVQLCWTEEKPENKRNSESGLEDLSALWSMSEYTAASPDHLIPVSLSSGRSQGSSSLGSFTSSMVE